MKKLVLVLAAATAALVVAVVAVASGGGEKALRSTLAPSVPTDPTFHGVAPGGLPWMLSRGEVRLKGDGELDLEVRGLVIPQLGTPGPVHSVSASLYCGADSETAAAATTGQVPLSAAGDASITETVALPATCLSPSVLVHPNGIATLYIALTGWRS